MNEKQLEQLTADAIKFRWMCEKFDGMKTATSERFLGCLGINDADVCLDLRTIIKAEMNDEKITKKENDESP